MAAAQEVVTCDLCEASPVQMYCNSCATKLCDNCVIKHISADNEKDHNVVIFKKKNTKPIFPLCKTHEEQICEMRCRQCDTPVCTKCLASGVHIKHNLLILLELFHSQKDTLKRKTTELDTMTYPKYEQAVSDLEIQLQNLPQTYDRLMSEIDDQGEEWHREVDVIINRRKQEVEKIKTDDLATLKKLLEEMKNLLSTLRQAITENNDILQSADITKVLDSKYTSPEMWDPPPSTDVTLPTFTPLPIRREKLHPMFGTLTAASMPRHQSSLMLIQNTLATAIKDLQLLDSPESPSSIHTEYGYHCSIACLSVDEVWVCGRSNQIKRFTFTGFLQEKVTTTTRSCPNSIAVTKQGELIYTDWSDRSINRVRHGKIQKFISLQQDWIPMTVCCTSSDKLLITMRKSSIPSRVVHYSGSTEKQVIQFDDQGKPLFSMGFILFIAENSDIDMICVSDWGTKTVVVLNQAGKLRFRYTGNLFSQKYKSFIPCGVVIDSMGHILVADRDNDFIHIIDQQGHFIRYIDNCHLCQPFDLSLDKRNTLYVAEFKTAKVKAIKYLA